MPPPPLPEDNGGARDVSMTDDDIFDRAKAFIQANNCPLPTQTITAFVEVGVPRVLRVAKNILQSSGVDGYTQEDVLTMGSRVFDVICQRSPPSSAMHLAKDGIRSALRAVLDAESGNLRINDSPEATAAAGAAGAAASRPLTRTMVVMKLFVRFQSLLSDGLSASDVVSMVPEIMQAVESMRHPMSGAEKRQLVLDILDGLAEEAGVSDSTMWATAMAVARPLIDVVARSAKGNSATELIGIVLDEAAVAQCLGGCCPRPRR